MHLIERLSEKRNEDGFTLVELLVVIVILGILAAIVVFAVGGITDKGTTAANNTDTSVLQAAEEAAYAKDSSSVPQYLTESALVSGQYLRSVSSKNMLCIRTGTASPAVTSDYFVLAMPSPVPATAAAANTACTNAQGTRTGTYNGSLGGTNGVS